MKSKFIGWAILSSRFGSLLPNTGSHRDSSDERHRASLGCGRNAGRRPVMDRSDHHAEFGELVSYQVGGPVSDKTGLDAVYDITLDFAVDEISGAPAIGIEEGAIRHDRRRSRGKDPDGKLTDLLTVGDCQAQAKGLLHIETQALTKVVDQAFGLRIVFLTPFQVSRSGAESLLAVVNYGHYASSGHPS